MVSTRVCVVAGGSWWHGRPLLYFQGCRHWTCAEQRLGPDLAEVGRGEESVRAVAVEKTPGVCRAAALHRLSTILIEGKDPAATGGEQPALARRDSSTSASTHRDRPGNRVRLLPLNSA